jgi:hypothetical protein
MSKPGLPAAWAAAGGRSVVGGCWAGAVWYAYAGVGVAREAAVVVAGAGEEPAGVAGAVRLGVAGAGVMVAAAVVAAIAGCGP